MKWTEAMDEKLRSLIRQGGLSFGQIASRIGVTRNSAIGRAHRISLKRPGHYGFRTSSSEQLAVERRMLQAKREAEIRLKEKPTAANLRAAEAMRKESIKVAPMAIDPPPNKRVPLAHLNGGCKWPLGDPQDPDFGFCGAERSLLLPYCDGHAARAYRR